MLFPQFQIGGGVGYGPNLGLDQPFLSQTCILMIFQKIFYDLLIHGLTIVLAV